MKQTLLTLLIVSSFFSLHADKIDLFIVAGHSNAQGWKGDAAKYPKSKLDSSIPFYYKSPKIGSSKDQWTTLVLSLINT